MHAVSLVRMVMVTSGRAVAIRAVPLACAVGLAAAVVFGGHGMRPSDLVRMMQGSLGVRLALWGVWIMLATSAIAPAFDALGTRTLRAMRTPRTVSAMLVIVAASAQAPWILLFVKGSGALSGVVAAFTAVAACASSLALRSRRGPIVFGLAWLLVGLDMRQAVAVIPAGLLAYLATRVAWGNALEERSVTRIVWRAPAPVALALAYVARMVRSARARLQAAAVMVFAGSAALALSLRNDPGARPVQRALVVLSFPLSIACAILAAPALETEARMHAMLRATRTHALTLALAMALALAMPSTAFAASGAAVATLAANAPHVVPLAVVGWSVVIAAAVATWARRASRARRSTTFAVGIIAIATAFTTMATAC